MAKVCTFCANDFSSQSTLNRHVRSFHSKSIGSAHPTFADEDPHQFGGGNTDEMDEREARVDNLIQRLQEKAALDDCRELQLAEAGHGRKMAVPRAAAKRMLDDDSDDDEPLAKRLAGKKITGD